MTRFNFFNFHRIVVDPSLYPVGAVPAAHQRADELSPDSVVCALCSANSCAQAGYMQLVVLVPCSFISQASSAFHNNCLCASAACMHTAAEVAAQREAARAAAAAVAQAESLLLDKPQGASPLFILFPETLNAALCCQAAAAGPRILTALTATWAAAFVAVRLHLSGNFLQLSLPEFTSAESSGEISGASRTLQNFAQQFLGGAALGLALRLRLISGTHTYGRRLMCALGAVGLLLPWSQDSFIMTLCIGLGSAWDSGVWMSSRLELLACALLLAGAHIGVVLGVAAAALFRFYLLPPTVAPQQQQQQQQQPQQQQQQQQQYSPVFEEPAMHLFNRTINRQQQQQQQQQRTPYATVYGSSDSATTSSTTQYTADRFLYPDSVDRTPMPRRSQMQWS
eukprot:12282-Heterococcus_DN1.PRE.2